MKPEFLQWALDVSQKALNRMDTTHSASPMDLAAAKFWVLALVEEIERRVADYGDPRGDALEEVFEQLKREFFEK